VRDLKARVAYLQGLSAGMNIETESKEGRILSSVIEVLDDFATTIKEMEDAHEQLENYLESIDEDLFHLEEDVYKDTEENSEEDEYLEVDCPRCGEVVCFESDVLEDEDTIEVTCPNCDEVVFVNDDTFQAADEPEPLEGKRVIEDDL